MNVNAMRDAIISASRISSGSRLSRLLRRPVQTTVPYLMRKLSIQRQVDLKTAWGGTFSGVLPEAVTSEIWRSGTFERPVGLSLIEFLKPGGCFVDIGAHFGFFSLLASKLVGANGQVLAIEAMPSTYVHLAENIRKNAAFDNVSTFQGAAYSEETKLQFKDFGVVASSLNSAFAARDSTGIIRDEGKAVTIQAQTVDFLAAQFQLVRIDLMKIDAESSEKFVIMGIKNILDKMRPTIVMEVGDLTPDGDSAGGLIEQLKEANYRPFHWNANNELRAFEGAEHISYANLVFLPTENCKYAEKIGSSGF
jgi:FkbM family methyltransferase